jgi:4,5-dihydroxyphthalate decarboxylase
MLPWAANEYNDTVALMGADYWRYGVQGNEPAIEAFLRYHHTQGLSERKMCAEDLFAPSSLEQFLI